YLVFIDGDCIPHRLFLQDHYERRETGAVLAGRRLMMGKAASARFGLDDVTSGRYENALRWVLRDEKHTLQYAFRLPWIDRIRNRRRSDYFVLGSNFSLYREDFLSVNGYDERIVGRGMEDNNLHARFCAAGMPVRSLSQAGLQYHLHHAADPIPHSAEVVRQFCTVTDGRTPFGIVRKEQC
ncbi:MAG: galactosyltransferase-related protein, partial [Chitinispirillaceae bacterium]|nr:galactosyltransferase-related protein [Chitinispirillaceae bacterium]